MDEGCTHDDGARELGLALDRLRRGDRDGGKRGEDRDDGELHVGDERVVRKNGEEETKGMGGLKEADSIEETTPPSSPFILILDA